MPHKLPNDLRLTGGEPWQTFTHARAQAVRVEAMVRLRIISILLKIVFN